MQLISVERWTFWAALAALVAGFVVEVAGGGTYTANGVTWNLSGIVVSVAFFLLLATVALGGSRDPSVRRIPAPDRS